MPVKLGGRKLTHHTFSGGERHISIENAGGLSGTDFAAITVEALRVARKIGGEK